MIWEDVYPSLRNSLLELTIHRAIFDVRKPYAHPSIVEVRGVGVIVDIKRGLFLTTAEVACDAKHISACSYLTSNKKLGVNLVSICLNRNVALCKLEDRAIIELADLSSIPEIYNMMLGDNLKTTEGHELLLMNHREAIPTVFTGYKDQDGRSHFTISTISETGGIVVNHNREMIGMVRPRSNLVIGCRTILCVYDLLLSGKFDVVAPTFSFDYNHTSYAMMEVLAGDSKYGGVYINAVNGDSSFEELEKRDVLSQIIYCSPFWECPRLAFTLTDLGEDRVLLNKTTGNISCNIDNYGEVVVNGIKHPSNDTKSSGRRRISLIELQDNIPVGSDTPTSVWRKGKWTRLGREAFLESTKYNRRYMQYTIHQRHFEVVGGMVISPLDENHRELPGVDPFYFGPEESPSEYLVVTEVFPGTTLSDVGAITVGDILFTVNSQEVNTLEKLGDAINSGGRSVAFRTVSNKFFIVDRETMNREDRKCLLENSIPEPGRIRR